MSKLMSANKKCKFCKVPFGYAGVGPGGIVYPCCMAYIKNGELGNIYEMPFDEIWNSPRAIEIRSNILNNDYSQCKMDLCTPETNPENIQLNSPYISKIDFNVVNSGPKLVKFAYDEECNVKCITCRDKIKTNCVEQQRFFDDNIEKVYLPILKNADIVCLNGAGDPLASRHCRKLIKAIVEKYPNIKFDLHTNGLLCNEKNLKELGIIDRLSTIEISVHATTKNTYEKIVRGGNFDTLIKNLEWLAEMKRRKELYDIQLNFVLWKANYKEMAAFVDFAKKYEAKAFFWNLRIWDCDLGKCYDEIAVFEKWHPLYNEVVSILNLPCFKEKHVYLNAKLKSLKYNKYQILSFVCYKCFKFWKKFIHFFYRYVFVRIENERYIKYKILGIKFNFRK